MTMSVACEMNNKHKHFSGLEGTKHVLWVHWQFKIAWRKLNVTLFNYLVCEFQTQRQRLFNQVYYKYSERSRKNASLRNK